MKFRTAFLSNISVTFGNFISLINFLSSLYFLSHFTFILSVHKRGQLTLKKTKTHISSYFHYKMFIIENNQWKFEQNQAKNKEVTALWNLAISRGRYSKWWQVVGQLSICFCTWNFRFFTFMVTETIFFSEIKIWQARMYSTWHIMKSGHENTRIERKLKRMKFCVQNEWRAVHNCPQ